MGNEVSQCINLVSKDERITKTVISLAENVLKTGTVNEDILKTGAKLVSAFIKPKIVKSLTPPGPPKSVYNFGEKGSGLRAASIDAIQDYQTLKDQCIQLGQLFEDKVFPAKSSSLFFTKERRGEFRWLRPKDIVGSPKFFVEGASRFDVCQGELGDCWLLAAVATLTLNKKLFHRVVPQDQYFDGPDYAGIFHFRFWQYGRWVDVVIDDQLPTINGKLCFMHSKDKNEFWSALLEKAYAKLHGSYEALKGGTATEAMTDFTGGLTEFYDIQSEDCPPNLLQIMLKAYERSSFMGCSVDALSSREMEAALPNGLIKGHAYSVTAVKLVNFSTPNKEGSIPLVRIRNPWGNESEWKGAWSDNSREWSLVSEEEKHRLELAFHDDGEFWMSFHDFKENFTKLEICNLTPEPLEPGVDVGKQWNEAHFEGQWISGVTAGGCRNHLLTFASNPQYVVQLVDYDENDDDDKCTLIVGLMQKNRRAQRKMGLDCLTIGFAIYALRDGGFETEDEPAVTRGYVRRQLLTTQFFQCNASVARSPNFINLREVSTRVRLPPGNYCIIPSTFDPNEEGEFLLRIFTEKPPGAADENDDEVGYFLPDVPQPSADGTGDKDNVIEEDFDNGPKGGTTGPSIDPMSLLGNLENVLPILNQLRQIVSSCWPTQATQTTQLETQQRVGQSFAESKGFTTAQEFFQRIAGEDLEVDAKELQDILNHALRKEQPEFKFDGFSLETCRSMVSLLDDDRSGNLGLDEFVALWTKIRHWCSIFRRHDTDNDALMSANELRLALQETGLSVNRHILQILVLRYGIITSGKKGHYKVERSLSFDGFIHACMKLQHAIDQWNVQSNLSVSRSRQISSNNNPSFTLDEWVERVMYC